MTSCKVLSIFGLLLLSLAYSQTLPGLTSTITEGGLTYLKDVGLPILLSQLSTVSIPDITGSTDTPVGHIDYELTNLVLTNLQVPDAELSLTSAAGGAINVLVPSIYADISMDWAYKEHSWPHVSDHGSADITLKQGSSVALSASILESNGEPQFSVVSCTVSISDLDIDLHGGASWLYQIFVDVFSDQIKDSAQAALQSALVSAVNTNANQALSTIPVQEPISDTVGIDYSLIDNPSVTPQALSLHHLAEFYDIQQRTATPFTPGVMPTIENSDMLQMFISDFVLKSASYVYYTEGQMQTTVTQSDIPAGVPISLNTSFFKLYIPGLYEKYPDMAMTLDLLATDIPVANFTTSGIGISAEGDIRVNVVLPNNTIANAFILDAKAWLNGTASVNSAGNLTANVKYVRCAISLESSSVGSINTALLTDFINILLKIALVPLINKKTQTGLQVPTIDGISLDTPYIEYGEGYMLVSANITYTPTNSQEMLSEDFFDYKTI